MSKPLTPEEEDLLKQFEKMLGEATPEEQEDIDYWLNLISDDDAFAGWGDEPLDSEDDEELPPPVPKCLHKNTKNVIISHNIKYLYCTDCKSDLGDIK